MPFSLMRISTQSIDLVISFDPPELRFKKDINVASDKDDSLQLMHLNTYTLPDLYKANLVNTQISATPTDENTYSLNIRSHTNGSHLYRVDFSSLENLKDALSRWSEIDFSSVSGLSV